MPDQRIVTGAHAILNINGKPYGAVISFRWTAITPVKATGGVDTSTPVELIPTTARIQGTVGLLRTLGSGGMEGAGVTGPAEKLPRWKYFSLMIIDRVTDSVLFRADACLPTNQSWDLNAKALMVGSLSFEGLDWSNEVTAAGGVGR